jgi:hypothetical protein
MNPSFTPLQSTRPESPALAKARGAAIYTHPDDVTGDPKLTTAEKRVVLASWVSDARAVETAPSLRRLDSDAVVDVDTMLQALALLDERVPDPRKDSEPLPPSRRTYSVISRWLSRGGPLNGSNDDDDDPPPAPAGLGMPYRPKPLPPAHDARAQWVPELACAA